jgi:hypothetical protein
VNGFIDLLFSRRLDRGAKQPLRRLTNRYPRP